MPTAYLLGLLAPFFWLQAAQPSGMATTVMHINIESMRNKIKLSCQKYHKLPSNTSREWPFNFTCYRRKIQVINSFKEPYASICTMFHKTTVFFWGATSRLRACFILRHNTPRLTCGATTDIGPLLGSLIGCGTPQLFSLLLVHFSATSVAPDFGAASSAPPQLRYGNAGNQTDP